MSTQQHRGKVLIVDDDELFRSSIALLLRMDRWQVVEAADGEEAVEQVRSERPDILLLDQRMPGLTGTEVYWHLRQAGIEIPAVLVTAANDAEHLARSVGIAHYLRKPFDFEQLQTVLKRVA